METTVRVEIRNSRYYVTRQVTDLPDGPLTKWAFLSADEKKAYENTAFTANGTGECSSCGEPLATEADFAKHFVITDIHYLNLGECINHWRL